MDGNSLYHYRDDRLYCSSRTASRTRHARHFPRRAISVPTLPDSVIPVTVRLSRHQVIVNPTPCPTTTPDSQLSPDTPLATDFLDMLTTLPYWQSSLLQHLNPLQPVARLQQLLESGDQLQLYLVSDGGAKDDLGSFGWELAIGRHILWTCMGPTFGLEPGSFRAESYGMLSAMLFLDHYLRFFQVDTHETIEHLFYCDNQGLLKRIGFALDRSWDNPNHCLASEYDLESGIVDILRQLPVKFSLLHVKGHQDGDIAVEDLPWEAQMNCHADALATDFLDNWANPSKIVPFIPASKVSISIAGATITRNIARRLRLAASSPALEKHIMTKNGWNDWIFHSIDWDAQAQALNTLEYNQELFVVKWAHDLLPTRRHMHRMGRAESNLCPSCLATIETATHIFACPRRLPWQQTLIASLRTLLISLITQMDLQLLLLQGLEAALLDPNYSMTATNRNPHLETLVHSQNDIGWSHLLRGRFSHHWVDIQQAHINRDASIDSKTHTGSRWLKKVLHHVWSHLYLAWKLRNADLHGIDSADQELKAKAKLKPSIAALYHTAQHLDYLDKRIFTLPLEERLLQSSREQTAWINVVTPTVRQAKAEAADHLKRNQPDIRGFFRRPSQP